MRFYSQGCVLTADLSVTWPDQWLPALQHV